MEIHTYRAASLQEALMLVRHDLGPAASILQTREVAGRFFGFGKRSIEVHASRDANVARRLTDTPHHQLSPHASSDASPFDLTEDDPQQASGSLSFDDNHMASPEAPMRELATAAASDGSPAISHHPSHPTSQLNATSQFAAPRYAPPSASSAATSAAFHDEFRSSAYPSASRTSPPADRNRFTGRASASSAPVNYLSPAMFEVFTEMLDADVDPESARAMLQEVSTQCSPEHLNDPWLVKGRLCQIIQQQVNVSGPIDLSSGRRQVVALVGPTGVGKTTTLAKLAAGFHFDQGASVGFVTLDTYRLGAVDQLRKYADLLGAACEVVQSSDQMLPALDRLSHCQLILIDTAGRSPRDAAQLETLRDFLRVASPTQIHLVLSAASSQAHAAMALEQFAALEPTHLLLTKLDESPCLGGWYRLLSSGTWPLSYITTGQQVPEDILVANRRRLASLILGQTPHSTWK